MLGFGIKLHHAGLKDKIQRQPRTYTGCSPIVAIVTRIKKNGRRYQGQNNFPPGSG